MLYCKKCGVSVSGAPNFCPLCQGELTGEPAPDAYPAQSRKPYYFYVIVKFAALLTIAAVCVCGVVSYSVKDSLLGWWMYVTGGAATFWATFGIIFSKRRNVTKNIMLTTFVVCIMAFFWDLGTGYRGWALDYVLPIACCTAMLAMAVIARIQNLHIEQYIYYLILDIAFGIIPFVLVLCGAVKFTVPSLACMAFSLVSLATLLLFEGKALRDELIRRTHM